MNMTVDEGANAGDNFVIAVIDWGIDYYTDGWGNIYYHPDLEDNVHLVDGKGGKGFRSLDGYVEVLPDHEDPNGHGTHVSGIIAAVDNDNGTIGTAPKAKIYSLKLITWTPETLAYAINYAANNLMARIIVMSLETDKNYTDIYHACKNAYEEKEALLFAAAGNSNSSVSYPAKYDDYVIAVGAVNKSDQRWVDPSTGVGSNFGPELDFAAPGVDINSTVLNGGYALMTGTSMAVPHVAAVAALIWSSKIDPEYDFDGDGYWDNIEVRYKLRHLALDLGPAGKDDYYGWGLINAWAPNQRPLGDINIDYIVDMEDLYIASLAYGSFPSNPNWDPRADINIDNFVDVEDIYTIALNYGKIDP